MPETERFSDNLSSLSPEEFKRVMDAQLQAFEEQARRDRREEFSSEEPLLWIALPPVWTLPLAEACEFPIGKMKNVREVFLRMEEFGWVKVQTPFNQFDSSEQAVDTYSITDKGRVEILAPYLESDTRVNFLSSRPASLLTKVAKRSSRLASTFSNIEYIKQQMSEMGKRILENEPLVRGTPDSVIRWAYLAVSVISVEEMIKAFDFAVEKAAKLQDSGEIMCWIEAARSIAALLSQDYDTRMIAAMGRADRRIELIHRRRADQTHLQSYLRREGLVSAFNDLMDGPDELWALHYLGPGGVGKTMLIRDIILNLTGRDQVGNSGCLQSGAKEGSSGAINLSPRPEVITARIDFDLLNADYPRLDPGLLLWSFAQELRVYEPSRTTRSYFDICEETLEDLRQELHQQRFERRGPATRHSLFKKAIGEFISALKDLGQERRILLILDTCEELAKVDFDDAGNEFSPVDNIQETFRILQALHDGPEVLDSDKAAASKEYGIPSLRVIFSGRRPLAGAGKKNKGMHQYGWSCESLDLPKRDFLRLYEARGFTLEETKTYLSQMKVPEELIPAVLKVSQVVEEIPEDTPTEEKHLKKIVYLDNAEAPQRVPRCNPYKLRLFTNWALETPTPLPQDILQAHSSHYVELRIIRRLGDDNLENLLPAVALLSHFDEQALRTFSDLDENDFPAVFRKLRQQEWINEHLAPFKEGKRLVLDVDRDVQGQLVSYYAQKHEPTSSLVNKAARYLEAFTLSDPAVLGWSDLDATLRVMEEFSLKSSPDELDFDRASLWWEKVERRMFAERDAGWVLSIVNRLLGEDGAVRLSQPDDPPDTLPENHLRPLVLATQSAALLQQGVPGSRLGPIWKEVTEKANRYSSCISYKRLALRGLAGQLAAGVSSGTGLPISLLDAFSLSFAELTTIDKGFYSAQLIPGCIGAVDAVLEYVERQLSTFQAAAGGPGMNLRRQTEPVLEPLLNILVVLKDITLFLAAIPPDLILGQDHFLPSRDAWQQLEAYAISLSARGDWLTAKLGQLYFPQNFERKDVSTAALDQYLGLSPNRSANSLELLVIQQRICQDFSRSIDMLAPPPTGSGYSGECLYRWSDWIPPKEFGARLLLQFLYLAVPDLLSPDGALDLLEKHTLLDDGTDTDRLRSLKVKFLLALRPLTSAELREAGWGMNSEGSPGLYLYKAPRTGRSFLAHSQVAPLEVNASLASAVSGWVGPAMNRLRECIHQNDGQARVHADQALLLIIGRLHLGEERETAGEYASDSDPDSVLLKFSADEEPEAWWAEHPFLAEQAAILWMRRLSQGQRITVPDRLLKQIGIRRAAELAEKLADLLTVERADWAERLYEQAALWFSDSGDWPGALLALAARLMLVLRSVGALGRSADLTSQEKAAAILSEIEEKYNQFYLILGLPSWQELTTLAGDATSLDQLPRFSRPLLLRIWYAILSLREQPADTKLIQSLYDWLAEHYTRQVDNNIEWPADWQDRFVQMKGQVIIENSALQVQVKSAKGTSFPWLDAGIIAVLVIIGILAAVAVIGFGYLVVRFTVGNLLMTMVQTPLEQVGLYALSILSLYLFIGLLVYLLGSLRTWWFSKTVFGIAVSQPDAEMSKNINRFFDLQAPLPVQIQLYEWMPKLSVHNPPMIYQQQALGQRVGMMHCLDEYVHLEPKLDAKLLERLLKISNRLRRRSAEIRLEVQPELHAPNWEALLVLNYMEVEKKRKIDLQFDGPVKLPYRLSRVITTFAKYSQEEVGASIQTIAFLSRHSVWDKVVNDAWSRSRRKVLYPLQSDLQKSVTGKQSMEPLGEFPDVIVLHLIGRIQQRTTGLRFQIVLDSTRGKGVKQAVLDAPLDRPPEKLDYYSQLDFSAAELVRIFPNLRLCVLHCEAEEGKRPRDASKRGEAALLRAFAAELVASGIPAALTLPGQDFRSLAATLEPLSRGLSRALSNQENFFQITAQVRDRMFKYHKNLYYQSAHKGTFLDSGASSRAWEEVLDICLFTQGTSSIHSSVHERS